MFLGPGRFGGEATITNDGEYSGAHKFTFTETRWYERAWQFLPYLPREIPLFAAVTVSFWGVAEVLTTGEQIPLKALAAPALLTAFVVAVYRAVSNYRKYVPEALASESKMAQKIYRNGECGWQFALAREMLTERLAASDRILNRVASGAAFIQVKRLALLEYSDWLRDRPETLTRLVTSVAIQCTSELPSALAYVRAENQLMDLKRSVAELSDLYGLAAEFEVECHSVQPPEQFKEIHNMTHGWSAPIRAGIHDFMQGLGELAAIDRRALKSGNVRTPKLQIEFKPPENVGEFVRRLQALR